MKRARLVSLMGLGGAAIAVAVWACGTEKTAGVGPAAPPGRDGSSLDEAGGVDASSPPIPKSDAAPDVVDARASDAAEDAPAVATEDLTKLGAGIVSLDKSKSEFELEPHVAVTPNGTVAVTWFGDPRQDLRLDNVAHVAMAVSKDDGQTWTRHDPPLAATLTSADPSLSAKPNNDLLLSYLGYRRNAAGTAVDIGVYATTLAAGASTVGPEVRVNSALDPDPNYDKPWSTVAADGTSVVAFVRTRPVASKQVLAAWSTDAVTWTQTAISPADVKSKQHIVFCDGRATNRLYATYIIDAATHLLTWSDDGGRTWVTASDDTLGVTINEPGEVANHNQVSCAVVGTTLYFLYAKSAGELSGFGENTRTKLVRLARLDVSGPRPVVIARDTVPMATSHGLFPSMVFDGAKLVVAIYATSALKVEPNGSLVLTSALAPDGGAADAGLVFSTPATLVQPITIQRARGTRDWLGDYMGVAAQDGFLHLAFVSNSTGFSHIAYRKVRN